MKKAFLFALVGALAISVAAMGGWKFGAEQGVDVSNGNYILEAYVGYDFEAKYIDMGPLSIAGDVEVSRTYDWAASPLSGVLAIDGELVFSYLSYFDVILSMGAGIDYEPLPEYIDLLNWDNGIEIVGYITDWLTINAGVDLVYRLGPKDFITKFFFGFDASW